MSERLTYDQTSAVLGVTRETIGNWTRSGCPWLGGKKLRFREERRGYQARLCNVGKVSRPVRTIAAGDIERIRAAMVAPNRVGPQLLSRAEVHRRYPFITDHQLRSWSLPMVGHNRYKKGGRRNRGNCLPLGKPLHVERQTTVTRSGKRESPFYRLVELEKIAAAIATELGRSVENGVEYKTTTRLRQDHRQKHLKPHQLAVWLPDHDYRPLKRVLPTRLGGRALARREQLLWPVELTILALDRRDAARRKGWRGRGRWIPRYLKERGFTGEPSTHQTVAVKLSKKRGKGRPGRTPEQVSAEAKLLRDYETAACGEKDFSSRRGIPGRELRATLKRARTHRARLDTN